MCVTWIMISFYPRVERDQSMIDCSIDSVWFRIRLLGGGAAGGSSSRSDVVKWASLVRVVRWGRWVLTGGRWGSL